MTPNRSDLPPADLKDLTARRDRGLLRRFYAQVLVPNFSANELVARSALESALRGGDRKLQIVVALGPRTMRGLGRRTVVGGAVGDWDETSGVYLLSYIAVRRDLRSKGLGAQLMGHVEAWWQARPTIAALAEVDDPRFHEVSDYGKPIARLHFYERLGAQVLALRYTQPKVNRTERRAEGMLLISFPLARDAAAPGAIRAEVLRQFLTGYLQASEGLTFQDAANQVDVLVPALAGVEEVPLLDMADFRKIRF